MPEQLDDEERIAAGVIGKLLHELAGGWACRARRASILHVGVRERAQHDGAGVPLADELIERRLDGLRREHLTRLTTNPVEQALKRALAGSSGRPPPRGMPR